MKPTPVQSIDGFTYVPRPPSLSVGIEEFAISTLEKTQAYWEEFVSYLAVRVSPTPCSSLLC
jgi:hypothetical protein